MTSSPGEPVRPEHGPPLHALFQRRIDGDDALLRLARLRFDQAGLAAEVYADGADDLEHVLAFVPRAAPVPTVHLSRDLDLLDPDDEQRAARLVTGFGGRVSGFVVHDRADFPHRIPRLAAVADRLSRLLAATGSARLFVEYAVGVRPEQFASVGEGLREIERVALCVDVGHVGIWQARQEFARRRPEVRRDLAALDVTDGELPRLADDVTAAVDSALPTMITLVETLAAQGKPVHFHLHDGHPLVRGLADHFGFLTRLPIPFRRARIASLDPLFGVRGLQAILRTISTTLGPDRSSLTLEIHPHDGLVTLPDEDRSVLFPHWRDLTHAERMNGWLRELAENAVLVRSLGPGAAP